MSKTLLSWNGRALCFVIIYVVIYTLFPLICQMFAFWSKLEPFYKFVSKAEIKDAMNAAFSVALLFMSIHYSGIFVDFHKKLTAFGITDVMFEHGASRAGTDVSCGVNRIHVHIVPYTGDSLKNEIGKTFKCRATAATIEQILEKLSSWDIDRPYFWIEDGEGVFFSRTAKIEKARL